MLLRKNMQSPYNCVVYGICISFPLRKWGVEAYLTKGVGGECHDNRHPVMFSCQLGRLRCSVIWSNIGSIKFRKAQSLQVASHEKRLLRRTVFCVPISFRSRVPWCLLESPVYQPARYSTELSGPVVVWFNPIFILLHSLVPPSPFLLTTLSTPS